MPTPATRLLTLIQLLQRRPDQKAAELAERLGVSVRTLHRYFAMLDELGVPVYAERGPHGGFSLVRGYKLPPLVFSPEEAVTLALGAELMRQMWGRLYHEAAEGALAKLMNVLPDEQRREIGWAQRSLAASGLNRGDIDGLAPSLQTLRQAARHQQVVQMTYHSANNPAGQERAVEPYGLALAAGWWYLVGFCRLRQAVRTFRVDRIAALQPTGEMFAPPQDFDLHGYIERMQQATPQVQVRMRFAPHLAHLAQVGRGYWTQIEAQADGSVEVTFDAPDAMAAASQALAYGPAVMVVDPPEVRRLVHRWALAAAAQYRDEGED